MSATATNSVLAHAMASRMICWPREPAPIIPSRRRSLAPRIWLPGAMVAMVPATPAETFPMKLRREVIEGSLAWPILAECSSGDIDLGNRRDRRQERAACPQPSQSHADYFREPFRGVVRMNPEANSAMPHDLIPVTSQAGLPLLALFATDAGT